MTTQPRFSWKAGLPAAAMATVALTAILASGTGSAKGASAPAELKATALANAPSLDRHAGPSYDADGPARAAALRASAEVPMPDDGNVNGIRWEEAGGVFGAAEVQTVVEANAFCQWLRAVQDGRQLDTAKHVLDTVPDWPGFRDQPDVDLLRTTVSEAVGGGGGEYEAAVAQCEASHEREVAYADQLGLSVSS